MTTNVRWAVSNVHPQFCANVLGLSLDLRFQVMLDPMLIHAPFTFTFVWNIVCRCNPHVGLEGSIKTGIADFDFVWENDGDLYGPLLYEGIQTH